MVILSWTAGVADTHRLLLQDIGQLERPRIGARPR